jgi:hypothetical protein
MVMGETLRIFVIAWALLHVPLYFIEWYRYIRDNCWYNFNHDGVLIITKVVLFIDIIIIIASIIILGLGYWIF